MAITKPISCFRVSLLLLASHQSVELWKWSSHGLKRWKLQCQRPAHVWESCDDTVPCTPDDMSVYVSDRSALFWEQIIRPDFLQAFISRSHESSAQRVQSRWRTEIALTWKHKPLQRVSDERTRLETQQQKGCQNLILDICSVSQWQAGASTLKESSHKCSLYIGFIWYWKYNFEENVPFNKSENVMWCEQVKNICISLNPEYMTFYRLLYMMSFPVFLFLFFYRSC